MIRTYESKRLIEYLQPNTKNLILFNDHGLGDVVMFMPIYNKLKHLYPDVVFNLKCNVGQEYFNEITESSYDNEFYIKFPEFNMRRDYYGMSKPEISCVKEIGIPFDETLEFTWKPKTISSGVKIKDNCIGVCFQVTSNPNKSVPYNSALFIWNFIKRLGFNPIEVHFEHVLKNDRNEKFDFIDYTCRDFTPCVQNVISVISQCKGYIGVNTGTFCMATSMLGNTLHMYKMHHFAPNYKRFNPVPEIDCRAPECIDVSMLGKYLESVK